MQQLFKVTTVLVDFILRSGFCKGLKMSFSAQAYALAE